MYMLVRRPGPRSCVPCLTVFPTFFGNNRLPRLAAAAAAAAAAPAFSLHRRRRRHEQKKPDQPNSLHRRRSRRSQSSPSFLFFSTLLFQGQQRERAKGVDGSGYWKQMLLRKGKSSMHSTVGLRPRGDSGGCPSFAPDPLNV